MASLSERSRPTPSGRLAGAAYVLAALGATCIGLWVVGDVSSEPYDSPVGGSVLGLRLPAPLYGDGAGTVATGAVGLVLVAASVLLSQRAARGASRTRTAWVWSAVAWSGLVGLALGAALRVVLAITWDANIGGGLLLMFGLPVLLVAWLAGLVPLRFASRAGEVPA